MNEHKIQVIIAIGIATISILGWVLVISQISSALVPPIAI